MSLEPLQSAPPQAIPLGSHLADEANHRIANHLAMLSALMRLQAKDVGRAQIALSANNVQGLLEEFAGRLDTVAEIHRLLAHRSSGAPVDVADYLQTIAQGLVSSLTANDQMSVRCVFRERFVLPAEQTVALGLLVGELVTNALKYSHPAGVAGVITIEASTDDDNTIAIEVSDDGVGLPDDIDPFQSQTLGFRTIRLLAKQLGALISFDDHGLGLSCAVRIPYAGRALKAVC
ncbi:MAG: sensor histidine kinase [Roseiarcus sp.]|uniref:sensor histidine kinase n=1 Tax=Roseiarcus sp. TaxID=1969460 RepID=UPI003BB09D14